MYDMDVQEIKCILHAVDRAVKEPVEISICGTAAMLLQGFDMGSTPDVDIIRVSNELMIPKIASVSDRFDFASGGMIGLLEDYECRLVDLEDGFENITVKSLNKKDWVVSRLGSDKIDDIWSVGFVDVEDLEWISRILYLHTGVNVDRAYKDISVAIDCLNSKKGLTNEFSKRN